MAIRNIKLVKQTDRIKKKYQFTLTDEAYAVLKKNAGNNMSHYLNEILLSQDKAAYVLLKNEEPTSYNNIDLKLIPTINPPPTPGVYCIRAGEFIKIGQSQNILRRYSDLSAIIPQKTQLIAILSTNPDDEARFQREFIDLRVKGEWFLLNEESYSRLKKYLQPQQQPADTPQPQS